MKPSFQHSARRGKYVGSDCYGFGLLTAGIILSIMILPYICAILRDVFLMMPPMLRESAYGIGCTSRKPPRTSSSDTAFAAFWLSSSAGCARRNHGRVLSSAISWTCRKTCSGATTIASTLANNFPEADGLQRSALFALGLVLLVMSFSIQILAQYYLHATSAKRGEER